MWLDTFNRMRKLSGMSLDELSEKSGVPKGTLTKISSGITKSPSLDTMKSLIYAMGFSLKDLDDGFKEDFSLSLDETEAIKKYRVLDVHGKRAVDSVLDVEYDRMTQVVEAERKGAMAYINCYDLAVSAGLGEPWVGDTGYKTRIEIPSERLPENAHYCVRVNGNSMEPAYFDGDIVYVQRIDDFVREGEIGIFFLNGDGYIKRLGRGVLESLNPEYAPIKIHEYDDLRCQGRVLGKLRN